MKIHLLVSILISTSIFTGCEKASDLAKVGVSKLSAAVPVTKMTASRWADEIIDGTNFGTDENFKEVDNEVVNKAVKSSSVDIELYRKNYYRKGVNQKTADRWDFLFIKAKQSMAMGIFREVGYVTGCEAKLMNPEKGSSVSPAIAKANIITQLVLSTEPHLLEVYKLVDELVDMCIAVSPGYENILARGYKYPPPAATTAAPSKPSRSESSVNTSISERTTSSSTPPMGDSAIKQDNNVTVVPDPKRTPAIEPNSGAVVSAPLPPAQPQPEPIVDSRADVRQSYDQNTFAPSFDCSKAASGQEKLICADRDLSKLDVDLNIAYLKAKDISSDKAKLRETQLHWLKYSRNACSDKNCLKQSYKQRIEELGSTASAGS